MRVLEMSVRTGPASRDRRENVESQYSRPVAGVVPPVAFSRRRGTVRDVGARAVPASTFRLADVDRVELEPASNRQWLTADDGDVVEPLDAVEFAARVQHRLLSRADTTLRTS